MVAPIDRNVTFRTTLLGEIGDFLVAEGIECVHTSAAIISIASTLATYREEGLPLVPEIYVCQDVNALSGVLQGSELLQVGSGPLDEQTALNAVKECAPLASGGWVIFIERKDDRFEYGLLTASNKPLALTPYEALVEEETDGIVIVAVRNIAENCVEIKGSGGNRRCLYFSDQKAESPPPNISIEEFCRCVTSDVSGTIRLTYHITKDYRNGRQASALRT